MLATTALSSRNRSFEECSKDFHFPKRSRPGRSNSLLFVQLGFAYCAPRGKAGQAAALLAGNSWVELYCRADFDTLH